MGGAQASEPWPRPVVCTTPACSAQAGGWVGVSFARWLLLGVHVLDPEGNRPHTLPLPSPCHYHLPPQATHCSCCLPIGQFLLFPWSHYLGWRWAAGIEPCQNLTIETGVGRQWPDPGLPAYTTTTTHPTTYQVVCGVWACVMPVVLAP